MLSFCYISGSYHFTVRGIVSFIVHLTGIEPFMGDPTIFEGSYMTQNNFGNCFHNLPRDFSVLLDGLSGNSETRHRNSKKMENSPYALICLNGQISNGFICVQPRSQGFLPTREDPENEARFCNFANQSNLFTSQGQNLKLNPSMEVRLVFRCCHCFTLYGKTK